MNYKDIFVKLKLDDIRKLVDNAKRYSSEKIVQVELDRVIAEIDSTLKALEEEE